MNLPLRLFAVLSVLALSVEAHAACENKAFDGKSLSRCKVWPAVQNQAIAVKSTYLADSDDENIGVFDLDLAIVNASNARPIATYRKPGAYNSDAISFDDLIIDTARYRLAADVRAFGLRSRFMSHGSRANPYSKTDLALYVREGSRLRPVLEGLVVRKDFGEGTGECDTRDTRIRRTIEVGSSSHNGFADLIVSSSGWLMEPFTSGKQCASKTTNLKHTQVTLIYDGHQYVVPEDFRGY